jgi:diguanylate cyclase (GGDEF)-like protein
MLDTETILEFAEELIHIHTGTYCSELQRIILLTTLQGSRKTYDEIADECGYSPKYIKQDVAPKLWQTFSQILGEKLGKSSIKAVLEQKMRHANTTVTPPKPTLVEKPPAAFFAPDISLCAPEKSNILLVDDQPHNLNVLSDLLEEQGYEVRQALNGAMALAAAAISPPDLILLDINMPEMDGYTVCQRLKADATTQAIPVIFVSALDEAWDKVKAFSVGGVDYIAKPFKVIEVLARVENHLKIQHLQKELLAQNRQLQQAIQELQRLAVLDELTQVANRRRCQDYLEMQWQESNLKEQPLSLILCSLDRLQAYNEREGHQVGDRCLLQVAQSIQRLLPQPEHLIGRYEGATFALILPATDRNQAQQIAESILKEVIAPVNLSLGLVTRQPSNQGSPEQFWAECAIALQQAQSTGVHLEFAKIPKMGN